MGDFLVWVVWFLAAAGCLGSGIAVITFTNPFYSALALISNLGSLAVLFLLASAEFLPAAGCLGSGIAVITFTNPFYSALALISNLGSLAVLFLLASAEFLAAAQVLVYAGAVMVMFLFVIAYLGDRSEGVRLSGGPSWVRIGAIVAATALLVEVVVVIGMAAGDRLSDPAEVRRSFGSPEEIGRLFLTDHLLAFEITSIVLLIAAVGGVVLGSRSRAEDELDEAEAARAGA